MGNQININVNAGTGSRPFKVPLTLESVTRWIQRLEFDEYTTKGLIELASNYPSNALPHFKNNINLMVNRVRAKRAKELGVTHEPKADKNEIQEDLQHNVEEV
jgi:hypothetical protein